MTRPRLQRGQASVELALVLPVLVILGLLLVQVAVLARDRVVLVHATRAAARAVIVDPDESAAIAALRRLGPPADRARVELRGERTPGGVLTVTVTARPTAVPIVGRLVAPRELTERLGVVVEGRG